MPYKSIKYRCFFAWLACLTAAIAATGTDTWAAGAASGGNSAGRSIRSLFLAQAPASGPATAPTDVPAAPRFEIRAYRVEGNTLLSAEQLAGIMNPFTGKDKDFGDVQRALEALQSAYLNRGHVGVAVTLPEQELDRGEVLFKVVETRIGKVTIEGNERFSVANVRRSITSLREGETPNADRIALNTRLVNESPAKQVAVLLRAGDREGVSDAVVRVADIDPQRYSVSLDNTGNRNTGRLRLGLAYQHANLFDRDHVLTAQFITSPENYHNVNVYGIGYKIPLYGLGHSIDFIAGYSNVDSGTVQDLFVVSGKGAIYGVRYNQNLRRWGDIDHRITYGLDYRAYQNSVNPVGTGGAVNLVPDITVHPFSVTYNATLKQKEREFGLYASVVQNFVGSLNDAKDENFKALGARFPEGKGGYRIFRAGGSVSGTISGDWQYRVRLDAQYTDAALISAEHFAIGGADNVRGVNERLVSNDKGYRTNWEIYTPDLAKHVGLNEGRLRLLAFYDTGVVRRNHEQPGELEGASLDTIGFGFRANYKTGFSARMDFAHILHDGTQTGGAAGARNRKKIHFSTAFVF